jgi:hypothetical protein
MMRTCVRASGRPTTRALPPSSYAYLLGLYLGRYSRYSFSNRSDDIRGIFCEHLDLLGIGWTQPNAFQIAIDRRAEVAKLDAFVGPKR